MPPTLLPDTDDSTPSHATLDTDAGMVFQTPYMEDAEATTTTAEEEVGQAAAADDDDSESVPIINMPSKYLPETDDSTPYVILDTEAQIVIQTSYMKGDGGEVRGKTCSAVFYSSTHNIL